VAEDGRVPEGEAGELRGDRKQETPFFGEPGEQLLNAEDAGVAEGSSASFASSAFHAFGGGCDWDKASIYGRASAKAKQEPEKD
jgi:hypothetical protein